MIKVFLKNGEAILHVDSDQYSLNGSLVSISPKHIHTMVLYTTLVKSQNEISKQPRMLYLLEKL